MDQGRSFFLNRLYRKASPAVSGLLPPLTAVLCSSSQAALEPTAPRMAQGLMAWPSFVELWLMYMQGLAASPGVWAALGEGGGGQLNTTTAGQPVKVDYLRTRCVGHHNSVHTADGFTLPQRIPGVLLQPIGPPPPPRARVPVTPMASLAADLLIRRPEQLQVGRCRSPRRFDFPCTSFHEPKSSFKGNFFAGTIG